MRAPLSEPFDPNALTPQQELFAQAYAQHGTGAEAHRQAYPDARYGRNSRRGSHHGELKRRGERAREALMNPKVAARILELMPNRIAELRANPTDDEAQHLAERLRVKLEHLRIRMAAATARERGKRERPRGPPTSAPTLAPSALGAEQLADLVRIAAREDMPAAVRREALAAALPQLEALRQALANTNGNGCVRSAIAPADDRGQHCDSP